MGRIEAAFARDRAGHADEAERLYLAILNDDRDNIIAAANLADIWIRARRYQEAATLLADMCGRFPACSVAWCNLSAALSGLGDHEQGLYAANRAVEADRKNAMAYYNRSECWAKLDQMRLAIRDLETALECDPRNEEIADKLAVSRLCLPENMWKHSFGETKYELMGKAHGVWIVDGIEVACTFQCPHSGCGGSHFVSMRGSGVRRGYCGRCGALTCGSLACDICIPFDQTLEEIARTIQ